ncbi:MAG: minor capsid protein [Cyanobacteria bacterium REEB65]|nr:minor capsid protein [Cyanobacteria bacterium REEB65]
MDRWVDANYPGMVAEVQRRRDAEGRFDDLARHLSHFEQMILRLWGRRIHELARHVHDIARRVGRENLRVFDQQNRQVLGVSVEAAEPWLADEEAIFAHENAALIKDIGATATRRVASLVTDCVRKGTSTSDLRKHVQDELGIATRRAALIAVDQVGKFNGRLTQLRQQGIGITHYRWRGVLDQRERPAHVAREGVKFAWDDPPSDGNPGEPIRCRCVAEPVMDIFSDLLAAEPGQARSTRPTAASRSGSPD